MADPIDLSGDIAAAINGAAERGHAVVLGYVGDDGYAAISFRGSTQVFSPTRLAIWARKATGGLVAVIAERPEVSLLFYEPDGPGAKYLSFHGLAHVDASANDQVYDAMIEGERGQDPERNGVAIVIDVVSVLGLGSAGPIQMQA